MLYIIEIMILNNKLLIAIFILIIIFIIYSSYLHKKCLKKLLKNQFFFSRIRNNFIAGVVVLIPIGITLYLNFIYN